MGVLRCAPTRLRDGRGAAGAADLRIFSGDRGGASSFAAFFFGLLGFFDGEGEGDLLFSSFTALVGARQPIFSTDVQRTAAH